MRYFRLILILFILIVTNISCLTISNNFAYQNRDYLILGQSTVKDALKLFGNPSRRFVKIIKRDTVVRLTYNYLSHQNQPPISHYLRLEFKNDILNGQIFLSDHPDENDYENYDNVKKIIEGETNKKEVLTLLGIPFGKALCPSTLFPFFTNCTDSCEIWEWNKKCQYPKSPKTYHQQHCNKTVQVVFNCSDKVIYVYSFQNDY